MPRQKSRTWKFAKKSFNPSEAWLSPHVDFSYQKKRANIDQILIEDWSTLIPLKKAIDKSVVSTLAPLCTFRWFGILLSKFLQIENNIFEINR